MPYVLTNTDFDRLSTAKATSPATFYRELADIGEEALARGEDIEEAVIIWLRGAADVNENVGANSAFIRDYNALQAELRFGTPITDEEMDAISDVIAETVFNDLEDGRLGVPGLPDIPPFQFPLLQQVAVADAQPSADILFKGDAGGWAGNPLFLFLGYRGAFDGNIIEAPDDTYDAWAMIHAMTVSFGFGNIGSAFKQIIDYPDGASVAREAFGELASFLQVAYGDTAVLASRSLPISSLGSLSMEVRAKISIGSNASDDISEEEITPGRFDSSTIAHAGQGDDSIAGSWGTVYIDGGIGNDTVTFKELSTKYGIASYTVSLQDHTSEVPFAATVKNTATKAVLFDIERLELGANDDVLLVTSFATTLKSIDAAESSASGDTVDVSKLSSSLIFDLNTGMFSSTTSEQSLELLNFENVVGTNFGDAVTGDEFDNKIAGRAGIDEIDGGAGNDTIYGGSAKDILKAGSDGATIYGGSGGDELFAGQDGANLYGGSGNDTLDARNTTNGNGRSTLYGGSGEDTLYGNGNSVLSGGSGVDTFYLEEGDVVTDAEAHDILYFNGVKVTPDPDATDLYEGDYIWGVEGLFGDFNPISALGTSNFGKDVTEFDIAYVFELEALPDNFDFTVRGASYKLHIFINVSEEDLFVTDIGRTAFFLPNADLTLDGFNRGDFGIDFTQSSIENELIYSNLVFRGELDDERLLVKEEFVNPLPPLPGEDPYEFGPASFLSGAALEAETLFEQVTEAIEDVSLLGGNDQTSDTTGDSGTDGDDVVGEQQVSASLGPLSVGAGDDWVQGSSKDDEVLGELGNDTLVGNLGDDYLVGGAGSDILIGGSSLDIIGGSAFEYVAPPPPPPVVPPEIDPDGEVLPPPPPDDTGGADGPPSGEEVVEDSPPGDFGGGLPADDPAPELPTEEGSEPEGEEAAADTLPSENDTLIGGLGNDQAYGGAGNDLLYGDEGDDFLDGGDDNDKLFGGEGADELIGGKLNDSLDGGAGNDLLNGGSGIDTLIGGLGDDELFGGSSGDTYIYARGDGNDTVEDYGDLFSTDTLVLQGYLPIGVEFVQDDENLILRFDDGATITIINHYAAGDTWRIENFRFQADARVDEANAFAWSSYVDTFDQTGARLSRTWEYDDGRTAETTYLNGIRSENVITDAEDQYAWTTLEQVFDLEGTRTSQVNTYDDGRVLETTFVGGLNGSAAMQDVEDAHAWTSYTDSYDDAGSLTLRSWVYDDGRTAETSYLDGRKAGHVIADAADQYAWTSVTQVFDASGIRTTQTNTYDDGRVLETAFAEGIRSTAAMTDVSNAHSWSSYVDSYDASGEIANRAWVFDDGRTAVTTYEDGNRSQNVITDSSDTFSWTAIDQTFGADGALEAQVTSYDDGRILDTGFENGIRSTANMTDVEDAYAWASYADIYDASGGRVSRTFTYDDGTVLVV